MTTAAAPEPNEGPEMEIEFVSEEEMRTVKDFIERMKQEGVNVTADHVKATLDGIRKRKAEAAAKAAAEAKPEPAKEQHPESRGPLDDDLEEAFFQSIAAKLFEGEGALDKTRFARVETVAMATNDPPRTKEQDRAIKEARAKENGTLGPHAEAKQWASHFNLTESLRGTLSLGHHGGSAYLDFEGDCGAVWVGQTRNGQVGVVIGVNGEQVLIPINVLAAMMDRINKYTQSEFKDQDPMGHDW